MPPINPYAHFSKTITLKTSTEYPYKAVSYSETDPSQVVVNAILKSKDINCLAKVERFLSINDTSVYIYQEGLFNYIVDVDNAIKLIMKEGISEVHCNDQFECRTNFIRIDVAEEHQEALKDKPQRDIETLLKKHSLNDKMIVVYETVFGGVRVKTEDASGMLMKDAVYWNGYLLGGTILHCDPSGQYKRFWNIPLCSTFPSQYSGKIDYFLPIELTRVEKTFQSIHRLDFFAFQPSNTGKIRYLLYKNMGPSWDGGQLIGAFEGEKINGLIQSGIRKKFEIDPLTSIKYCIEERGDHLDNELFFSAGYTIRTTQLTADQKGRRKTTSIVLNKSVSLHRNKFDGQFFEASENSIITNSQKTIFEERHGLFQSGNGFIEAILIKGTRKYWVDDTTTGYTLEDGEYNTSTKYWKGTITHRNGDVYEIYTGKAVIVEEQKVYDDVEGSLLIIQPILPVSGLDVTSDFQGVYSRGFKDAKAITAESYHFICVNKQLVTIEAYSKDNRSWSATRANGALEITGLPSALKKKEHGLIQENANNLFDTIEERLVSLGYVEFCLDDLELQQKSNHSKKSKTVALLAQSPTPAAVLEAQRAKTKSHLKINKAPIKGSEALTTGCMQSTQKMQYEYSSAQNKTLFIEQWKNYLFVKTNIALPKILVLKYHHPKDEYIIQGVIANQFLNKGTRFKGYVRRDHFLTRTQTPLKSIYYQGTFFCDGDHRILNENMHLELLEGVCIEINFEDKSVSKSVFRIEGSNKISQLFDTISLSDWRNKFKRDIATEARSIFKDPFHFYKALSEKITLTPHGKLYPGSFFSAKDEVDINGFDAIPIVPPYPIGVGT